jgi:transcriptional regulator with GAF, ATPase, and Fis domain
MTAEKGNAEDDRMFRIYAAVARRDDESRNRLEAICHSCMDVLPVSGAGVMLMAERAHQGTLYATDDRIAQLEDLQNAAAEGPCIESYNLGRPVLAPDLDASPNGRWPLLSAAALKVGIHALFSFPLQLDDTSIGALDLYRDRPGPLTKPQIDDARLLAAMATREVLALQESEAAGSLPSRVADLSGDRATIEQATGMIAAQMNSAVSEAAREIRRLAADQGRPLAEIAHDVVARVLRVT